LGVVDDAQPPGATDSNGRLRLHWLDSPAASNVQIDGHVGNAAVHAQSAAP
jgi:hypothetical protein